MEFHKYLGYTISGGFGLLVLLTIFYVVRNRIPHDRFWTVLGVLQAAIAIQLVVGLILFASGGRPQSNGPQWLHYVYGAAFPGLVLVVAHRLAAKKFQEVPWVVFGVASFFCCFSTIRALQTGLGID